MPRASGPKGHNEAMPAVPTITCDQLDLLPGPQWMLLDVRTEAEWADGRIRGSFHIPLDELTARVDEVSDKVVCICAAGVRSAHAAVYLNSTGRRALNLDGGLHAWAAGERPISR